MAATTRPLGVEVYGLTNPAVLEGWSEPQSPRYAGMHGLRMRVR